MLRTIIIALSLLWGGIALGQTPNDAKSRLSEVSEQYRNNDSYRIAIEIAYIQNYQEPQWQKGELTISGQKYLLEYGDEEIFCDTENNYRYNRVNNEIVIEPIVASSTQLSPQAYLAINTENYTCQLISNEVGIERYKLTNNKIKGIGREVEIEVRANQIGAIIIPTDSSQKLVIRIVKTYFGEIIPDSLFEFDASKYADVEVIDFRD